MFASLTLTALFASAALLVRADVDPTAPGPGDSFNEGSTCSIAWNGDTAAKSPWTNMSIQLMSGSNLAMNAITTVTTAPVDGSQTGTYQYPCPAVTPNSAIYFYQFSNPTTSTLLWTTRFTIASSTGASTPPANAQQPGSNDPIPWGTGALVNPSTATPPPPIGGASGSSNSTSAAGNATSSAVPSATSSVPITSAGMVTSMVLPSVVPTTAATASPSSSASAAAAGLVIDSRIWHVGVGLGAAALAFVVLL